MTAQIIRLEARFENVKGCKTRLGAAARLEKFIGWAQSDTTAKGRIQTCIITTDTDQFVPVVILAEENCWMMHYAITCGCAVTN